MSTRFTEKLFLIFPELQSRASDDDKNLPHVLMAYLVDFLESCSGSELPQDVVKRLVEFNFWCRAQPRGESAKDDIYTLLVVGLYEKILKKDDLYPLIVKLVSREQFLDSKEYLLRWIDERQYSRALGLYSTD
jgi:hypothetical protein